MANEPTNFGKARNNNFGFLRLLFAGLVIVSHSPELVDGNRSREILTRIFGTMSFGEIAVDGFFLISGYLITKSFIQSSTLFEYFLKRIFRILPAYVVCFLICVFCLAPFVGATISVFSLQNITHGLDTMLRLLPPEVPGVFSSLHYPVLDGPIWTIAYEFRCYIGAAIIGLLGLYKLHWRLIYLGCVAMLILCNALDPWPKLHIMGNSLIGGITDDIRFFAIFGTGSLYFLFRDRVTFTWRKALIASAMLCGLMFSHRWAEAAFTVFGAYILFWFAFKVPVLPASRFDNGRDVSYGLYLYAWPIQNLILWNDRSVNPWLLCSLTFLGAGALAYASWNLVEEPALRFLKRRLPPPPRKQDFQPQSS